MFPPTALPRRDNEDNDPVDLTFPSTLYGRNRELEALSNAYAKASGGQGLVLLVSGVSGSGKTALVRALRETVVKENGLYLEGKFNQYQQEIPLFAVRQALRQLARELVSASSPERCRWKRTILDAVGDLGRLLTDIAPELQRLVGPQPVVPEISPYEAPHRFASVLRNFLGVFCQPEHPVVLFIDDWQWADTASLDLLHRLQVNQALRYLLVIASYRDDEVTSAHPFMEAVDELHRLAVPVQKLQVRNLGRTDVQRLLADALPPSIDALDYLADLVHGNAGGNPFFVRSLIDFFHADRLLWFDRSNHCWRWDAALVESQQRGGDVVRLFALKLHRLPPECRDLLSLAACIGNCFDVETLALASERTLDECRTLLEIALSQKVIRLREDGPEVARAMTAATRFVFQHDRVQQAAHSLLAPEQLPAVRLRIGRLLLSHLPPERLEERLLEVTDHLNAGRHLLQDPAERLRLVELNIAAGHKARVATAFRSALQFHRIAGEFLACPDFAETFWNCRHDQALQLYKEWGESEFLEGDRTESERCIHEAVQRAKTPLEEAGALCVLIVHYTLLAKYPEAIETGRQALAALGIMLPESDWEAARDAEIANIRKRLRGRSIASLWQLPLMTDPVNLMATKVLITMGPPCYRSHQRLWSVIVPKVVDLTLEYGHIPQVGYSHTGYGGLLGWVSNDYATAREFGELATRLMTDVFRSPSDHSVFYLMIGSSLRHWSQHLSAASRDFAQAWEAGLRSGNLQYAAYAIGHDMYCRFYQGQKLSTLIRESQDARSFSRTRTNQWAIDLFEGGLHVFGTLAGAATANSEPEHWSDEDYYQRLAVHQNIQVACIYRVLKSFALLVLGQYERALVLSDEADALIETVGTQGLLPWPEHVFTRFLLRSVLDPESPAERQDGWRHDMDRTLEQLHVWARECPANYSHKYALAQAEIARRDGHLRKAFCQYERAIQEAQAGGFIQWEAVANERAAHLAQECREERLARIYWQNAYVSYQRWGAGAKVHRMEVEFRSRLFSRLENVIPQLGTAEPLALGDVLKERVDAYFQMLLAEVSSRSDKSERDERARLIAELTKATAHLREEVAERKRVEADLQRHREQLAQEIEERTAACERAERANEALRESEERFRLVSRATNDAIWDWDLTTDSLWWSEGFETLFGYRREEVEQTIHSWTNRIHPQDYDEVVSSIYRSIESGDAHWSGEYRYRCMDGTYAFVLDRGYIIRDASGKPFRMIGGMTDLTERKNLEAQLLQNQKTEAIGRLAGGIAHDFNNLLTVIRGCGDMLLSDVPNGDPRRPLLIEVCDAAERAANLTRQLLAFSRKQLLNPQVLDLNALVTNIEKMLERLIGEDIRLTSRLSPDLRPVKVDPGQLEQVIINLAINSRDAMPEGGRLMIETENVEINAESGRSLSAPRPGRYVALTIADTGVGMSADVQTRLFEPFFTTKPPGKGTGLGLSTVFGIVKQSDGYVDVESEVGVGTRFRILFPAVSGELRKASPQEAPVPKGSETVLLVEDEEAVRKVAKRALQMHGYDVLEAANGRDAIRVIENHRDPIHLVITDVVMPDMGGRELVEHLRRHRSDLKTLFMSGYTDDAVLRQGLVHAADAFLQKPFTPLSLAKKVRELIEK